MTLRQQVLDRCQCGRLDHVDHDGRCQDGDAAGANPWGGVLGGNRDGSSSDRAGSDGGEIKGSLYVSSDSDQKEYFSKYGGSFTATVCKL